jgi:hypothetical protein
MTFGWNAPSYFRRPSAGWGLSRLSVERSAIRRDAIGSSLRWSDGVFGRNAPPRPPRLCVNPFSSPPNRHPRLTVTLNLVQGPFFFSTLRCMWHDGCTNEFSMTFWGSAPSYFRRPSVGWGLSRLSAKRGANQPSAIGSSCCSSCCHHMVSSVTSLDGPK